ARTAPVPEERRAPVQEERPVFAPKRPEPIIVPPPPPPPPPPPVAPEPKFEADFILHYLEACSPDVFLLMGGAAEWQSEGFALGRLTTAWLSPSMRRGGPVWPKFDQDKLKRQGRLRPMAASYATRGFAA